jgi:hypothetical protein
MSGFSQVFGGTTIAPANATFLSLVMATDVELAWPIEQAINGNVVADTIEVNASAPGLNIDLPDARQVSTGYTTCFNNVGAQTVSVRSATDATLLSLVPGSAWVLYLADNSTEGGTWRIFQLGASVSVAVAAALAGAGLRAILTTLNQDIPITSTASTPVALIGDDRAKLINWTGGLGVVDLPSAPGVGNGWYIQIRNSGSGDLTVTPPSGTIDGAATKTFAAGTSAVVVTDGTDYLTLGFGSGSGGGGGSFDFVEIDVAGSGDFVLAGVNLNRISYRFIGVLTGTRNIVVPNAIQQYWVSNGTTGAFSLFVKTALQTPGIEVLQNNQSIMYCDGSDVIDAESSSVSFPIPVAQGGTGAVNAAAARTNLGATSIGDAVFVAANTAAAQTAIGIGLALNNTFTQAISGDTGPLKVDSADPGLILRESDAAANNRLWRIRASGEQLIFDALTDALAATTFIAVDRTAGVIDQITISPIVVTPNVSAREVGYKGIPQVTSSGNYTAVLADANCELLHPNGAGAGDTFTIPSNAAVPYPIGTMLYFTNRDPSALSVSINSDTLILAGNGTTGTRSIVQNGMGAARKVEATVWLMTGPGVS